MAIRSPDGSRAQGSFLADHGFRGFRDRGLALRRTVLDAILLDAARTAGAVVVEGEQVTDLMRDPRGAVTGVRTLADDGRSRERRASLVVGADGLRSVVGRRLGLTQYARRPRRLAFVTHYRGVSGMTSLGEMHVERDGYAGLASVDDGLTNVAIVAPVPSARAAKGRANEFVEEWLANRPHLAPRFVNAERIADVRVTGPFAQRARSAWHPGAVLIGDAADFFDPFTGEGIYAALRGGEILAPFALESLAADAATRADAALQGYDTARRAAFAGKWQVERLVGLAVSSPMLMNLMVRRLGARPSLTDLIVGVTGDFVPPRSVLSLSFLARLLASPRAVSPHALKPET
jgi:flavin-dependent dehydrogenase